MGRINIEKLDDGRYLLKASYFSKALVDHSKSVPGMNYDPSTKGWIGYSDAVTATAARLSTTGITVSGLDLLTTSESWRTSRSLYLYAQQGTKGYKLREYQDEGVRFLLARSREGALLADGMRLGKSAQAVIAARAFKAKTLIVCQSHVVGVWGRGPGAVEGPGEVAKWWPDAWKVQGGVQCLETVKPFKPSETVRESRGKRLEPDELVAFNKAINELQTFQDSIAPAQVIICHYDILYAWVNALKAWGVKTLILDELHICAGWQSRRAAALKDLRAEAVHCIGLTGTPITNLPRHAHNVLEILCPGRFGYFFTGARPGSYAQVFCDAKMKEVGEGEHKKVVPDYDGRSNLDEPDGKWALTKEETLKARLKFMMLRRLKKEVDPQLPEKVRQIVDITIPPRQIIGVAEGLLTKGGAQLRRSLDLAADGKFKSVVSLVTGHVAEEEKVICFCYRRLFAERVAEEIEKKVAGVKGALVMFVHGGLSQKERDRKIHQLRAWDGPGVLACTIDTTATGIDLSFASVAVVAELTYEPHEFLQCEERLYKFGGKGDNSKSLIQYVIARGTGDELILRAVINKLDIFERVVGSTGDAMRESLETPRGDPMKRLYAALKEMQQAAPSKGLKARRKASDKKGL